MVEAALGWFGPLLAQWNDRRRVRAWLKANTRDEPGKSHLPTGAIAKGARLTEERARAACFTDPPIRRFVNPDGSKTWSVWREEPEHAYQFFVVGGRRAPQSGDQ